MWIALERSGYTCTGGQLVGVVCDNVQSDLVEDVDHVLVLRLVAVDAHEQERAALGRLVALHGPREQPGVLPPADNGSHAVQPRRRRLQFQVPLLQVQAFARRALALVEADAAALVDEAVQLGEGDGHDEVQRHGVAAVRRHGPVQRQREEAPHDVEEPAQPGDVRRLGHGELVAILKAGVHDRSGRAAMCFCGI